MTDKEIFEVEASLEALQVQQAKQEAKLMELRAKNAEKLAKRKITAKEAKEIANSSTRMLSQIYKIIRDEAAEGRVRLNWCVEYLSKKCKENITKALREDGFVVSDENNTLTIQW